MWKREKPRDLPFLEGWGSKMSLASKPKRVQKICGPWGEPPLALRG